MARRASEAIGLGLIIIGLLVAGVVTAILEVSDDDDEMATTPTTVTTQVTTTTAAPATTTSLGTQGGAVDGTTSTTIGSGLADNGTGDAGDTDGGTPATGLESEFLVMGGLASLLAAAAAHRLRRRAELTS